MDAFQIIAPLIGVVLGSALTGFGVLLNARKERRRLIAVSLTDLLEIRHRMIGFDLVLKHLRSEFQISKEYLPLLRNFFDTLAPLDPDLDKRFNDAVSLLSGIDPIMSFTLRSKIELPKVLFALRNFATATTNGSGLADFETFESLLRSSIAPSLNEAVISLANSHSIFTWFKVKALIKRSETLPPEAIHLFAQLKAQMQKYQSSLPLVPNPSLNSDPACTVSFYVSWS
jgi:hypothetical protein